MQEIKLLLSSKNILQVFNRTGTQSLQESINSWHFFSNSYMITRKNLRQFSLAFLATARSWSIMGAG